MGGPIGYLREMAHGENLVANTEKHENIRLLLHAVITSIKNDEIINTAQKGNILAAVSTENENHGWIINVVRNMRRLRTVDCANLDSRYENIICLLLCVR